jgi:hypothetical protein
VQTPSASIPTATPRQAPKDKVSIASATSLAVGALESNFDRPSMFQTEVHQSAIEVARRLSAHFTTSVRSGSIGSHFTHLKSVLPLSAITAFIRLLQCGQRVASIVDLHFFCDNARMEQKFSKSVVSVHFRGEYNASSS